VNSTRFSPFKPLAISLSLALGILVADVTSRPLVQPVGAQTSPDCSQLMTVKNVPVGTSVAVTEGTVTGSKITARGVIVSGEEVDGVFETDVTLINGVIVSGEVVLADGLAVNSEITPCVNGVIVSGEVLSTYGVIVSGEETEVTGGGEPGADGSPTYEIVGGTVQGDNLRVEGGVIRGENLRVVGGYVVGDGIQLSGASMSVSLAPTL